LGFFDALRAEVEQTYGIGVSVIVLGTITTAIGAHALLPNGSASGNLEPAMDGAFPWEQLQISSVTQMCKQPCGISR
jgi:hypothetical protein